MHQFVWWAVIGLLTIALAGAVWYLDRWLARRWPDL
jgi:hypothetical protein